MPVLMASLLLPAALGVTTSSPGTVTTIVDPHLFTKASGDEHLHGIVRDPISGNIYVGDWNSFSVGNTPFFGPYIQNADSIRRINALEEVSVLTYLIAPNAITYSATDRQLYVVSGSLSCGGAPRSAGPALNGIVAINPATGASRVLAGGKPGFANGSGNQARFTEPAGIAYDSDTGSFYVSEGCLNRIRQVDSTGFASTLAGSGQRGSADGAGTAATFNNLRGIAYCDHALYVADSNNNEIRHVSLAGNVTTLAGSPEAGYAGGRGATARFNHPTGIACDEAGNLYVADSRNNAIRKVTPAGFVSTVAGNGIAGTVDGVGSAARFSTPGDLTYDPDAHALYVVDWGSNDIRKVIVAATAAR